MWSDSIQDALRVVKEISHGLKRRKTTALSICRWCDNSHALKNEALLKTLSRHHDQPQVRSCRTLSDDRLLFAALPLCT